MNTLGNSSVDLLATCITVATLVVWMGVFEQPYESRLLGAIEGLFLANVLILSVSTLYMRSAQGSQAGLVYTSTGLSVGVNRPFSWLSQNQVNECMEDTG